MGKLISLKSLQLFLIYLFMMAIIHRNPERGIFFHSYRGSQDSNSLFRELFKNFGIIQSIKSTGNRYDNVKTESFINTLKAELSYWKKYQRKEEAKRVFSNK